MSWVGAGRVYFRNAEWSQKNLHPDSEQFVNFRKDATTDAYLSDLLANMHVYDAAAPSTYATPTKSSGSLIALAAAEFDADDHSSDGKSITSIPEVMIMTTPSKGKKRALLFEGTRHHDDPEPPKSAEKKKKKNKL